MLKESQKTALGVGDVYIVWEHTNFAAKQALEYNLASLKDKEAFIEKTHREDGGLILLQKSHQLIVPGEDPKWDIGDFYRMLLAREKIKVSSELLEDARRPHDDEK
jgi:hypothetical protein